MFRKAEWLVAAALVLPLAACVETVDSGYGYSQPSYGYGYGYGNGYSGGYYPSQAYYAPPVVYSQTRYVPVSTPVPVPQRQADRDHRWDGHHDQQRHDEPRHVDRQPTPPPPAATHNNPSGNTSTSHHDANRRDGNHDGDRRS
jgi:hypothetical protein